MSAHKRRGGPLDGLYIEPAVNVLPAITAAEYVAHRAVVDYVAVALADRIADGVKIGSRFLHDEHGHVVRQLGIDGPLQNSGASGLSV